MSIDQPGLAEQATTSTRPPAAVATEQATRPRLIDQQNAARILGFKTTRTVRNLITRGELTGYRVRGVRAIRVDLNEVRALVETIPVAERSGRRVPFGPRARIVNVGYAPETEA